MTFSKGHDHAKLTRALANPTAPGIWDDLGITGSQRPVSPWAQLTPPPAELLCPPFPPDDSETTARELAAVARAVIDADQPIALNTVSRFLTSDIPVGRAQTIRPTYQPRTGFYGTTPTTRDEILKGRVPERQQFGAPSRITTPRVLASVFHQDEPFWFGLTAAMLLHWGSFPRSSLFPNLPTRSRFVGDGGILSIHCLLAEATDLAMRACWYTKWSGARRRRPEELAADPGSLHPIWQEVGAPLLTHGLLAPYDGCLPLLVAEGAPCHPAYPSGHAVIGGAVATVLLATFADRPMAASDQSPSSTHEELRKLAKNFGEARIILGIHYQSDVDEGLALGERAALLVLRQAKARAEQPWGSVTFRGVTGLTHTV
jgi:membrane-associated phospholipid phosphatase